MMINLKKTTWAFLFIFLLLGIGHLYFHFTGDFRIAYVLARTPYPIEIALPKPTQEEALRVETLLDQNYYYLGHGNQTYVFVSEDGEFVLKLFKKDYLQRTRIKQILPPVYPFRQFFLYEGAGKESRKRKLLRGHAIAYARNRDNTGLVYFHLDQDIKLAHPVTLIDPFGFKRDIALNDYVFAIQEKAITTRQELSRLLSERDVEGAKQRIRQLFELYLSDYRKGISDNDYNLIDNTGFVGNRAIRQDVGKIVINPQIRNPAVMEKDLKKIIHKRLLPWFKNHYPNFYSEISLEMEKWLSDLQYTQDNSSF